MSSWARHVRRPGAVPPELQQLRDAARDIAEQAGHAPSRARVVFQTVADCALIGTAVISGALAAVHLYRALLSRPRRERHSPQPEAAGAGGAPPHSGERYLIAAGDPEGSGAGRGRG